MTRAQIVIRFIAIRAAPKEVEQRGVNPTRKGNEMGSQRGAGAGGFLNQMRKSLTLFTTAIFITLSGAAQAPTVKPDPQPPIAAVSPFIDVHVHLEKPVADESIQVAVKNIPIENIAKYHLLPSPFDEEGPAAFDVEFLKA